MFGFIKKLITGILGFITGLLPGKKGNGYYLELDEPASEKAAATPKTQEVSPVATANGAKPATSVAVNSPANAPAATKASKVEPSKNGKAPKAEPATTPAATSNGKRPVPAETTFAPKYLAPSGSSSNVRRRPGANMSSYLDMASKMKTSN
ncbi:hypothetical protein [Nodularia sphaerocarpa]|uniref:hypothetical protein n=1 Tax=Nodularia sphaerocarpa TaxID=137816 RepID=UPI001EFC25CD|nr:hypothetical protein [Nodularia sphaerocarpa]MDB9374404.1 hypothetical protein [Nodularia sphaerocarpa CS-585]MDB9376562.1 hypothetical protein [Nodularia sphaerocarpa CS-585A2]ULP72360.1 hypothetical protein BDGGKGIB_02002 [Nodularia sphaerocarpa UHCC 0038]